MFILETVFHKTLKHFIFELYIRVLYVYVLKIELIFYFLQDEEKS